MTYVYQHPNFGLGNFINLTPAIRWLSEQEGRPIPVFFSTEYVRQCFIQCPFIEILKKKPNTDPVFSSALTNPNDDYPDYWHVFRVITGNHWMPKYHTYVDRVLPEECQTAARWYTNYMGYPDRMLIEEYPGSLLLINGSGSDEQRYIDSKDVGETPYRHAAKLAAGWTNIVSCGSYADMKRAPYMVSIATQGCFGNMRRTLGYLAGAKCVIANDTGLAHAAGALNKPLLVLWKNTPRERCKNAGTKTQYAYENHMEAIESFLKQHLII